MPPAARITDLHTCPATTGPAPHVGGPVIAPGSSPNILINGLPAATVGTMAICVGPPDVIVKGSTGVFFNGLPAARMGDLTSHGGVITSGSPNVIIGEIGPPSPGAGGMGGVMKGLVAAKVTTPKPPPVGTIVKIDALTGGTPGKRNPSNKRPDNILQSSASPSEDLSANAPTVLVRGCLPIHLTATTTPPDSTVTWVVKPIENKHGAPSIAPAANSHKAILQTNGIGSFSVIGTSGSTKVVWNVIFVSVEVDIASTSVITRNNYLDGGPQPGYSYFVSGQFATGQYAWEANVNVKLIGGGSDGKMGVDKIKLKILQNGVADTLTGHYAGPPPHSTVKEKPRGGLPVLDSNGPTQPTLMESTGSVTVTPVNGTDRQIWTGDSPTGAFLTSHQNTHKALLSISGINGFKTAVGSISDDALNELVLHAATSWQAHFDGTVDAAGTYTGKGAHTSAALKYYLLSAGTGGQDACNAGFETFEPRFNEGTDTIWHP